MRDLVDLSITLAPHVSLNSMMKKAVESADSPLSVLTSFLRLARLAELSSFGRIAEDRLKVIDRLNCLKDAEGTNEKSLQQLISVWSKRNDFSINPAFQAVFFVTFCSIYLSNIRVGTLIFT